MFVVFDKNLKRTTKGLTLKALGQLCTYTDISFCFFGKFNFR